MIIIFTNLSYFLSLEIFNIRGTLLICNFFVKEKITTTISTFENFTILPKNLRIVSIS